jgi:iron complex transport system substrate-binding protein
MTSYFQPSLPRRIVCLTEETTETLYLLGAQDLIVGVSGFTVRPKEARKTKPTVSTYLDANIEKILELQPDVVLAWSDLQANICAELMRAGVEVVGFNHRNIDGIASMIARLGALIGKAKEATALIETFRQEIEQVAARASRRAVCPRVYFEEWYDPLISGICWVSELIEIAGGIDIFVENRQFPDAKRRIIANADEVVRRRPDIMIASWCGKMFKPEKVLSRPGWESIPAVCDRQMFEIPSAIILQPGPAAVTEGLRAIVEIIDRWEREGSTRKE